MTQTFDPRSNRAYTLAEIDQLRAVVKTEYLFGLYAGRPGRMSRSYQEVELNQIVEERVRTFMLAGVTADDLLNEEKRKSDETQAQIDAIIADAKTTAGEAEGAFCGLDGDGCP